MSFGENYTNKFLFDFEDGWTAEMVREWAVANGYNINLLHSNLRAYRSNQSSQVLMVYTTTSNPDQTQLSGYFCIGVEARDSYGVEGWEFVSSVPEEILI